MNKTVRAALDADLATMTAVANPRAGASDLGYGTDLSCVDDFAPDAREVDPTSRDALVEALIRQLTTPRGRVIDAPDYGYDLRGALNRATTDDALRALAGDIRNELTKDDRVSDVDVDVETDAAHTALRVALHVEAVDPRLGEFAFVFVMTPDAVTLEDS